MKSTSNYIVRRDALDATREAKRGVKRIAVICFGVFVAALLYAALVTLINRHERMVNIGIGHSNSYRADKGQQTIGQQDAHEIAGAGDNSKIVEVKQ